LAQCYRSGMPRRRTNYDPLTPIPAPTWLVARDRFGTVLDLRDLAPGADLRAILTAERERRLADGWAADEIGRCSACFFCTRDGERVEVGILRRDPRVPFPGR
jgi:hypothetical protein